jgi:hypothetical protein
MRDCIFGSIDMGSPPHHSYLRGNCSAWIGIGLPCSVKI